MTRISVTDTLKYVISSVVVNHHGFISYNTEIISNRFHELAVFSELERNFISNTVKNDHVEDGTCNVTPSRPKVSAF